VRCLLEGQLFGSKSEKMTTIDPTQATLDLGDLSDIPVAANDDVAPVVGQASQARRAPSRNIGRLPKHLPRYDEIIEPENKVCSCCSFDLHRIGEDFSEALDIVPAVVRVKRTIRPRYACRACESAIVQSPAPARVMDGGMVTTAFAAHVAVSKFAWHLPLHRQAQMLASCGVIIDRGTLGAWVTRVRVAWWLELLYDALTAFIRSQPRVFCDETPLPRLDPGRKRTKLCQLWAQAVDDRPWNGPPPPAVAYTFAESRSAREVEGQLSSFAGVLQVDGYRAYKTMAKRRGQSNAAPLRLAFCLARPRQLPLGILVILDWKSRQCWALHGLEHLLASLAKPLHHVRVDPFDGLTDGGIGFLQREEGLVTQAAEDACLGEANAGLDFWLVFRTPRPGWQNTDTVV